MVIPRPGRQAFTCLALLLSLVLCALAGRVSDASPVMNPSSVSDEALRQFLASYGWEVTGEAAVDTVTLPAAFGPSYQSYLDCQHQCGFQLERFAGETAARYTYCVTNYPSGEKAVFADLLVFQGEVIGGDIRCADLDGFLHSLLYPK